MRVTPAPPLPANVKLQHADVVLLVFGPEMLVPPAYFRAVAHPAIDLPLVFASPCARLDARPAVERASPGRLPTCSP